MDRTITFTSTELNLLASILRGLEPIRRGLPQDPVEGYVRPQPHLKSQALAQVKANGVARAGMAPDNTYYTDEFAIVLRKIEAAKWRLSHDEGLVR